jgi:hypothetical protein
MLSRKALTIPSQERTGRRVRPPNERATWQNWPPPRRVRCAHVAQKRKECGAHHQSNQKLARAALRFARIQMKRTGRRVRPQTKEEPQQNWPPPRRVRCAQVAQKRKGCGAHHQSNQKLARAALRFARIQMKRTGRRLRPQTKEEPQQNWPPPRRVRCARVPQKRTGRRVRPQTKEEPQQNWPPPRRVRCARVPSKL